MSDKIKLQNAVNFVRSELQIAQSKKMDKIRDYTKIIFLQKLLNKLI